MKIPKKGKSLCHVQIKNLTKFLQPSESLWKSGGPLMVFQQPESEVLTEEQAKKAPFQDFADR